MNWERERERYQPLSSNLSHQLTSRSTNISNHFFLFPFSFVGSKAYKNHLSGPATLIVPPKPLHQSQRVIPTHTPFIHSSGSWRRRRRGEEEEKERMGRSPCCEKAHTNKGAWTKEEDDRLIAYIRAHGEGCWRSLPKAAGLLRCGKSCRLRWINYLRPDLKRGNFTEEEDELIIKLHSLLGNK